MRTARKPRPPAADVTVCELNPQEWQLLTDAVRAALDGELESDLTFDELDALGEKLRRLPLVLVRERTNP